MQQEGFIVECRLCWERRYDDKAAVVGCSMQLKDYDDKEGKRVWLTTDEVEQLIEATDDTRQKIGIGLGVRSGLRRSEIVDVSPEDIIKTPAGLRVRVWDGKGDKYRETPLSGTLHSTIEAYADVRPEPEDTPLVDVGTRTIERWVKTAACVCEASSGDVGWTYLTPHDLRRTWGTLLVESEVEPGMVMEWGGWKDWSTFREHYLGVYSEKMQREQISKVDWL